VQMSSTIEIKKLEKIRSTLIRELLSVTEMIPGAFNQAFRKCGKRNCWCLNGKGHPFNRIIWSEEGKVRTKSIPDEDKVWIKRITEIHREFKGKFREIQKIDGEVKKLINAFRREVIKHTRVLRKYL